jgi:squalene synthase HpnC
MSSPREALPISPHQPRAGQSLVLQDLSKYGPESESTAPSLRESQEYCKSLAKSHYENFSVASCLIPSRLRQDMYHVYSYCRWSDDLADELGCSTRSLQLLDWWRGELHQCFLGKTTHPVFIALDETRIRHALTIEPFEDLLNAFVQDQSITRYETDDEVLQYCRGSANPVGRILLQLAKVESPDAIHLSDCVCTGLQIANFCQDVSRDAARDRVYLPRQRWRRYGVSEQEILSRKPTMALKKTLEDWSDFAKSLLVKGLALSAYCPTWLARDVQLFARGGLAVLTNIQRAGFDVWSQSIEVSKSQKFALLLRSIVLPRSARFSTPARLSRSSQ